MQIVHVPSQGPPVLTPIGPAIEDLALRAGDSAAPILGNLLRLVLLLESRGPSPTVCGVIIVIRRVKTATDRRVRCQPVVRVVMLE
jgi:hypothetical protein